jgi:hypothetical protein
MVPVRSLVVELTFGSSVTVGTSGWSAAAE